MAGLTRWEPSSDRSVDPNRSVSTTSSNRIQVFYLFLKLLWNSYRGNFCWLTLNYLFSSFESPGNCVSNLCFCNIKLQIFICFVFLVFFLYFILNSFRIQNNQFHSQLSEPQQMSGTCVHVLYSYGKLLLRIYHVVQNKPWSSLW